MKNPNGEAGTRYWLLIGDVPQGPLDVAQVHDKLASGEATWQTQGCPVGGSTWLPLLNLLGPGPAPVRPTGASQTAHARTRDQFDWSLPLDYPEEPSPRRTTGPGPSRPAKDRPPSRPILPPTPAGGDEILNALPAESQRLLPSPVLPEGPVDAPVAERPTRNPIARGGKPAWLGVVVAGLLIAVFGWLGYGWLRPLTPREVCERFDRAGTAQEAKRYCTLNMHAAVEALHRQKLPDSDDPSEYTQEGEAPAGVGGYFVGIRGQYYDPDERRRVQVDGVIHLIKSDGWKIEDLYFLSIDRRPLPEPVSLASNPHLLGDTQPGAGLPAQPSRPQGSSPATMTQAKSWYENRGVEQAAGRGVAHFFSSGGGKAVGVILLGIVVAVFRFGKELLDYFTSGPRR